ncbi:MAG: hypothetical protein RL301_46, partial [Actinomycetota bacterium]
MKRALFVITLLLASFFVMPAANAADVAIYVTEPSHRQIDGFFIDDELVANLSYDGRLGQ